MRIRTIKPEFFTHDVLFEGEKETKLPLRVAFAGIWCACDRKGRFKWQPRPMGAMILPYDGVDFSRVLDALLTRGFLVKYQVGGEWFGAVPSWEKHQHINNRESESVLPDASEAQEVSDASSTRGARVGHATEGEGKGKEGKGKENTPLPPASGGGVAKCPFRLRAEKDPPPEIPPEKKLANRVAALFRRKPETKWVAGEVRAWEANKEAVAQTSEHDWRQIEAWFALPAERAPYRRTDLAALLNNWHAEFTKLASPHHVNGRIVHSSVDAKPECVPQPHDAECPGWRDLMFDTACRVHGGTFFTDTWAGLDAGNRTEAWKRHTASQPKTA